MISGDLVGKILGIIILETASQFCARKYYENNKNVYLFVFAWFLYLPVLALLVLSYQNTGFAMANALWDSGTIIAMAIIGYFYFKENFTTGELVGIGLVVAGAFCLGYFSDDQKLKK